MIPVLALLAAGAWGATGPRDQSPPVFEMSVHAILKETGREARAAIEKPLRELGGAEVLTGAERKVAFTFGRAAPAELRGRLLKAIDALAGVAALKGEKEALNPSFQARRKETAEERAELAKERGKLASALSGSPRARTVIDDRLAALAGFDPSKEERQSVLVVFIEAPLGAK